MAKKKATKAQPSLAQSSSNAPKTVKPSAVLSKTPETDKANKASAEIKKATAAAKKLLGQNSKIRTAAARLGAKGSNKKFRATTAAPTVKAKASKAPIHAKQHVTAVKVPAKKATKQVAPVAPMKAKVVPAAAAAMAAKPTAAPMPKKEMEELPMASLAFDDDDDNASTPALAANATPATAKPAVLVANTTSQATNATDAKADADAALDADEATSNATAVAVNGTASKAAVSKPSALATTSAPAVVKPQATNATVVATQAAANASLDNDDDFSDLDADSALNATAPPAKANATSASGKAAPVAVTTTAMPAANKAVVAAAVSKATAKTSLLGAKKEVKPLPAGVKVEATSKVVTHTEVVDTDSKVVVKAGSSPTTSPSPATKVTAAAKKATTAPAKAAAATAAKSDDDDDDFDMSALDDPAPAKAAAPTKAAVEAKATKPAATATKLSAAAPAKVVAKKEAAIPATTAAPAKAAAPVVKPVAKAVPAAVKAVATSVEAKPTAHPVAAAAAKPAAVQPHLVVTTAAPKVLAAAKDDDDDDFSFGDEAEAPKNPAKPTAPAKKPAAAAAQPMMAVKETPKEQKTAPKEQKQQTQHKPQKPKAQGLEAPLAAVTAEFPAHSDTVDDAQTNDRSVDDAKLEHGVDDWPLSSQDTEATIAAPPVDDSHNTAAPVGFFGWVWSEVSWFCGFGSASPTSPPPATKAKALRTPHSKTYKKDVQGARIDGTYLAAKEDARHVFLPSDSWGEQEQQDEEKEDMIHREDVAERVMAETKESPRGFTGEEVEERRASHASNFWAEMEQEDGQIEEAMQENTQDFTTYEKLQKLQDAQVERAQKGIKHAGDLANTPRAGKDQKIDLRRQDKSFEAKGIHDSWADMEKEDFATQEEVRRSPDLQMMQLDNKERKRRSQ
jgi:hypothetical protein